MKDVKIYLTILVSVVIFGCQKEDVNPDSEIPQYVYAGGETTIFDATSNAFATPAPNLTPENFDKHLDGDLAFEQIFVTAPAEVNPGLGPIFNNNSCVSCHIRNGRSLPSLDGDELSGFLLRISVEGENAVGGPKGVPFFGGQLQNKAIVGSEREGNFTAEEVTQIEEFLDGTTVELKKPIYTITDPFMPLPPDVMISPRIAPAVHGLGLIEAIPEEDILMLADEGDSDGDGISGKPNMVWNIATQTHTLGRFGWKAENPTALQQSADAFHQDMGITTSMFSQETCIDQPGCQDDGSIDISDEFLKSTTFYFQTLAVPAMRNYDDEQVQRGRNLFFEAKCNSCHTPMHVTGDGVIPEVSGQTFYPYTDLLLHDMGEGLADNRPSFRANGREWRTPPLWGIGLLPVVNGHSRLLHDGRARNIAEAILWHGGEGQASKEAFVAMDAGDRAALIAFLKAI